MSNINLKLLKYYWTFIAPIYSKNRRAQSCTKNVLLFKTDGLGDFFLLVPFIQNLLHQQYNVFCVGNKQCRDIINHLNLTLTFIDLDTSSVDGFKRTISTVNKHSYDFAFNLSMNIWGGFVVNQSFSSLKIGLLQEREHYIYKGASLFYDKMLSYTQSMHTFEVLQNAFTNTVTLPTTSQLISFQETDNHGYITLHPYANWRPRIWPYYKELIVQLLDKNITIHLLGTSKEHSGNTWLREITHNRLSVITLSSIDHLMTEIDHATAFIGNDSGPAHYASLIGKKTIVIWGPGFFERIHPVGRNVTFCKVAVDCRPCRQKGDVCLRGDNDCLKKISVVDVLAVFDGRIPEPDLLSSSTQKQ
jgi:ADP-heptose:LPS heptosyltransferase